MSDFTPEEMKVIERFRNTQLYKLDCQSDFKTLRSCYKVSKTLYEALKYFDSRASRFCNDFSSYNQKMYSMKRRYSMPSEYYSFRFFDVSIEIEKSSHGEYFVACVGFKPWTFPIEKELSSGLCRCASTKVFSEILTSWQKVVFEFLDRKYNGL